MLFGGLFFNKSYPVGVLKNLAKKREIYFGDFLFGLVLYIFGTENFLERNKSKV